MKTDLASAIGAAIVGLLIAFFVTNFFTGEIEDFSYKTVETTVNADLGSPNPEVFNYRALNPTVEVYTDEDEEDEETNEEAETDQENF